MGGDRRRIELMNSLLFTLQGTPVIRYGEEIGMGDDLRLPERLAIRTPMQWSPEPNAGFSSAPPEKLIRPVISEGPFGYERVNVATQRLDQNSLLNWTERAIRARKECPEFGWGRLTFLDTDQPAVLAHACTWRGRTLVGIHNFSHRSFTPFERQFLANGLRFICTPPTTQLPRFIQDFLGPEQGNAPSAQPPLHGDVFKRCSSVLSDV